MTAPSDRQWRYAYYLHKSTGLVLPDGWKDDVEVCSAFIVKAKRAHRGIAEVPLSAETKEHIARIERGELKHDPGPWDDDWKPGPGEPSPFLKHRRVANETIRALAADYRKATGGRKTETSAANPPDAAAKL